jgi:hypothetical protein
MPPFSLLLFHQRIQYHHLVLSVLLLRNVMSLWDLAARSHLVHVSALPVHDILPLPVENRQEDVTKQNAKTGKIIPSSRIIIK